MGGEGGKPEAPGLLQSRLLLLLPWPHQGSSAKADACPLDILLVDTLVLSTGVSLLPILTFFAATVKRPFLGLDTEDPGFTQFQSVSPQLREMISHFQAGR